MADKGYVNSFINALPENLRYPLRNSFWYLMDNWRIGTGARAINAQLYRLTGTTHATANTEFSIKHGMDGTPTQILQVLDLSVVNSQIVPLTVSKAADGDRIYLKSSSTGATFTLLAEL
jgi:hypothetical protein